MDVGRFRDSPIGSVVPIQLVDGDQIWEHVAFVPDPLPTEVTLHQSTWRLITEATGAVTRLDGAAHRLPNPYLLVRPSLTREAVSTSALEGTYAALEDVLQAELWNEEDVAPPTAEVRNYVLAAERGIELIRELPICKRLVTEVHGVLMRGARGDHAEIGAFRRRQNWIGTRRDQPVTESLFVPPPAGDYLDQGLDDWERWVNDTTIDLPTLVKIALAHYQFETLHPFIDGNGRVGRLLIVLTLLEAKDLTIPLLNVSPFFENARDEYIDHLRRTSETGDFEPWIRFFAEAVHVQATRALSKADALIQLRDDLISELHAAKVRSTALRIVEDLIGYPYLTARTTANRLGVSYETANTAIARLVDTGILREATGRTWSRIFVADRVIAVLNRD